MDIIKHHSLVIGSHWLDWTHATHSLCILLRETRIHSSIIYNIIEHVLSSLSFLFFLGVVTDFLLDDILGIVILLFVIFLKEFKPIKKSLVTGDWVGNVIIVIKELSYFNIALGYR